MLRQRLELRVRDVISRALSSNATEDAAVELKREWPKEHAKAARRLAAHCNAAGGEDVLWIVGVDSKVPAVIGAASTDLATWWPSVQSCFSGPSPDLISDVAVSIGEQAVVGLLFRTDQVPYMVTNPPPGQAGSRHVELEAPWREGTRTRTAQREDLLRLLLPRTRVPSLEWVRGAARYVRGTTDLAMGVTAPNKRALEVEAWLYVTPTDDGRLVFPYHKARCGFDLRGQTIPHAQTRPQITTPEARQSRRNPRVFPHSDASMIHAGATELIVRGPGMIIVQSGFLLEADIEAPAGGVLPIELRLTLPLAGSDLVASLTGQVDFTCEGELLRSASVPPVAT